MVTYITVYFSPNKWESLFFVLNRLFMKLIIFIYFGAPLSNLFIARVFLIHVFPKLIIQSATEFNVDQFYPTCNIYVFQRRRVGIYL